VNKPGWPNYCRLESGHNVKSMVFVLVCHDEVDKVPPIGVNNTRQALTLIIVTSGHKTGQEASSNWLLGVILVIVILIVEKSENNGDMDTVWRYSFTFSQALVKRTFSAVCPVEPALLIPKPLGQKSC
jgi:hypothetical protein